MPVAAQLEPVAAGLWLWRLYDSQVKAELFSTAVATTGGLHLIDPVDLAPDAIAELQSNGPIKAVVVTNENHDRAAGAFAAQFGVPLLRDRGFILPELTALGIDGGPPGEIALHSSSNGGTLIIGDALINFEPYGFALLPAKYCSNAKLMVRSLPKLLDYSFERIFFAHGMPILSGARQRLAALLGQH